MMRRAVKCLRIARRCASPAAAVALLAGVWVFAPLSAAEPVGEKVDFNRDIRPILANKCFKCHGPDAKERKGGSDGLRLDTQDGARQDLGGYAAIAPGKPEESEVITRITSDDPDVAMPPKESGKQLTPREVQLLTQWVREGAAYAQHWSYVKPARPPLPDVHGSTWPRNEVDHFILARLQQEGLSPTEEADRYALVRRVALDLTGLPPTLEEVDAFVNDNSPGAYEQLVDRMLAREAYGEHLARMWLDLARYADSAGYADDPARTIWGYRDYVIRAFNANKRFDQFTVEQIAGDLLPDPTEEQLIATAFHRNTQTNNEGGTNDEEFRNVAIVDRVNTTMAAWMGTTINCAQCHNHKYDPISQQEFFQFYAFFNNTDDADRGDESPLIEIYTREQKQQKADWQREAQQLEETLRTPTPELIAARRSWEARLASEPEWTVLHPAAVEAWEDAGLTVAADGTVRAARGAAADVYTLHCRSDAPRALTALRLETLPDAALPGQGAGFGGGNFVITQVKAWIKPPEGAPPSGRFVRIELPGRQKILSLAEVQVFRGTENIASGKAASQSSTAFDGPAERAIDGNTDGRYAETKSTTHTAQSDNPWWEVDLKEVRPIDRIVVWNRTDNNLQSRLAGFRLVLLDEQRQPVWEQTTDEAPSPSVELSLSGERSVALVQALADYSQSGFDASNVLESREPNKTGWAVGGQHDRPHALVVTPAASLALDAGAELIVAVEQLSEHENHTLARFRLSATEDPRAGEFAHFPADVVAALRTPDGQRNDEQRQRLTGYYLSIAPSLQAQRDRLAQVQKQLAEFKPFTTVPVMREVPEDKRRTTHLQFRGNYLDEGDVVTEGVPAVFPPLPEGIPANRMALARWLISPDNPLTARVMVNRFWEKIFGEGIVRTSEEFGTQGELPTHPELLDWLAVEFMESGWDMKATLKLLVTSAAYRQSSKVTPALLERDPDNRLLARGPRVRLTAEMIRDQALLVGGLLSPKLYGPPVRPPQPSLGLSAAFGSGIDWQTSDGEDRYRRGLYTNWRRSNPYPSMATFDAPNREVCTLRRARTNTPLQAFVTLNDPVFVEAAQALARRIDAHQGSIRDKAVYGFRQCLARPPHEAELDRLAALYDQARRDLESNKDQALALATKPLGPAPEGADMTGLAAWTVVGNVLLNLDETLMKR